MITEKSITLLESMLPETCDPLEQNLTTLRNRFQLIDKYLQKESATHKEATEGKLANQNGQKDKFADPEIAITKIQQETAEAYFAGTFLNSSPIFPAVAPKQFEEAANQMTALSKRDEERLKWVGNLLLAIKDAIRFNICAVETGWEEIRASTVQTNPASEAQGAAQIRPIIYEGNAIKRLDPYNLILDPTVNPFENHEKGSYAGYVEQINYIQYKEYFAQLDVQYTVKKNIRKSFSSNSTNSYYFRPIIRRFPGTVDNNWTHFWGNSPTISMENTTGVYEKVVLYKKLIPAEWKINLPRARTPQMFKLVFINNLLIYAEPVIQGHEYLPIIVGQLYPGNIDDKSFIEYVMDLQDMGTGMVHGMMDSFRRSVYDRALYDPTRIRKQDIDSPNPVSKIQVQSNLHQQDIRTAYMQIPYENRDQSSFGQGLQLAFNLSEQTTGQNQASQGRFIKGNKSVFEFESIMNNSEARLQLGALNFSQFFFNPLKEILKTNYLVNAAAETITNSQSGEAIDIDPNLLREVAPNFMIGDGIMPSTKIMNTELLFQAIQTMSQIPQVAMEYDIGAMIMSVFRQQGLTGLQDYRRTPEQMAQMQQQMLAAQGEQSQDAAQPNGQTQQVPPVPTQ